MSKASAAAAVFVLFAGAPAAMAVDIGVGDYIRFSDGPGTTVPTRPGGEFIINVHQSGETFRSFCLEATESMYFGSASFSISGGDPTRTHPFEVTGIGDRSMLGGPDADEPGTPGDPISSRTAFLYQNFVLGTLAGYTFGGDSDPARIQSADALQNSIWFLENEINDQNFGITDPVTQALITQFLTMDMGGFTGTGLVQVLNIRYRWDGPDGTPAGSSGQDILVLIPLPSAAGMGLLGLVGVAGAGRRRR